jgi:hypothetical protein
MTGNILYVSAIKVPVVTQPLTLDKRRTYTERVTQHSDEKNTWTSETES